MGNFADGCYSCDPGTALIAKAVAGQCGIRFIKARVGSGYIPEGESPETMIVPSGYVMDIGIASVSNPVDGECHIIVQINSADVDEGFFATGIVIYAEDPDLGEVPFTYLVLEDNPEWIRSYDEPVGKVTEFEIISAVGNIERVSAFIAPLAEGKAVLISEQAKEELHTECDNIEDIILEMNDKKAELGNSPGKPATKNGTAGSSGNAAHADHTHPFQSYSDLKNKPFEAIAEDGGISEDDDRNLILKDKQLYDEAVSRSVENHKTLGFSSKNLLNNAFAGKTIDNLTATIDTEKIITLNGTISDPDATRFITWNIFNKNEIKCDMIKHIPNGTYIVSGGIPGKVEIQVFAYNSENDYEVLLTTDTEDVVTVDNTWLYNSIRVRIIGINPGFNNTKLYLMLRDARITDPAYVPYSPPLTDTVSRALENYNTIGYSSKNLIKGAYTTQTTYGMTFTVQNDKSIVITGENTHTGTVAFTLWDFTNNDLPTDIQLELTGCPSYNGVTLSCETKGSTNWFSLAQDTGDGGLFDMVKFKNAAGRTFGLIIAVRAGTVFPAGGLVVKPMIKDMRIVDSTYEPYKPSVDERLENLNGNKLAYDKAVLSSGSNQSIIGYNVLDIFNLIRYEISGGSGTCTETRQSDGSILFSGNTSSSAPFFLSMVFTVSKTKEYIISGTPKNQPDGTYMRLHFQGGSEIGRDTGEGFNITLTAGTTYEMIIRIAENTSCYGLVFHPMIRDARTISERLAALEAAARIS